MDFKINMDFKDVKSDATLTITLSKELLERAKVYSKKIKQPLSRWMRKLLTGFLDGVDGKNGKS